VSVRTVLVVDDDPDIRELVTWKLSQAGYATLSASDGEAAVDIINSRVPGGARRPDLILLDWMMPRMSGLEVCRALHEDAFTADIPIIFLTAKAQEAEVERGFAAGIDDYIVKPFSPREMLSRVEAVLARSLTRS
jgi:DNA-binding response OmpR family regulator